MPKPTRRRFLEESMIATGIALAQSCPKANAAEPEVKPQRVSVNETIRHAVIGCRIRGRVHAKEFASMPGVEVAYVCDPDARLRSERAVDLEKQTGKRPQSVADMRKIFDDDSIDTVSIAAPNHWHGLAAIWAMQSGKDVYVEKPVSHNVVEGRRMVQAAQKYNRICQGGTQNRSRGDLAAAAEYIQAGKLGQVSLARTIVYGRRNSIGPKKKLTVPKEVDLNLWLGPAAQENISRPNLHYDWHWVWDTGNGELGNNNIHYVDIVRWLVGLKGLGDSVISVGGRLGYEDAGETPNTQVVVHEFNKPDSGVTVIQEVRGLQSDPFSKQFKAGHVIHGSQGIVAEGSLFDLEGNLVKKFEGPSVNHFENFIAAVRSRQPSQLRAEIAEGHQSTSLCHIGNISQRLGQPATVAEIEERLSGKKAKEEVQSSLRKMVTHLRGHGIDLEKTQLRLGPQLTLKSDGESFADNEKANLLLGREYRAPFVVPDEANL